MSRTYPCRGNTGSNFNTQPELTSLLGATCQSAHDQVYASGAPVSGGNRVCT